MRGFFLFLILCFLFPGSSHAEYPYNPAVDPDVWEQLTPYFLPEALPIKTQLDKIFSKKRAVESEKSLKESHFRIISEGEYSSPIVVRHKNITDYIFKVYTDYGLAIDEWENWLERIEGSETVRSAIESNGFESYFRAPKKWIYPLPITPLPKEGLKAKHFILVCENMHLINPKKNKKAWNSVAVSPDLLDSLYTLLNDEGLCDCVFPLKLPFSEDSKICFVDTEHTRCWPVHFEFLTKYLSKSNRIYWKQLVKQGGP